MITDYYYSVSWDFFYLRIIDKFLTFIRVRLWPFVDDFITLKNKDL